MTDIDNGARQMVAYVTLNEPQYRVTLDLPHGLIPPPFVELHEPQVGPLRFYHAVAYALEIRS